MPAALDKYGDWMRVSEVAEYLGISSAQVTAYRDTGALRFINIPASASSGCGADWRISKESLAAFERKRESAKP